MYSGCVKREMKHGAWRPEDSVWDGFFLSFPDLSSWDPTLVVVRLGAGTFTC